MNLKTLAEKHNLKFVRKAQSYGVPASQQAKPSSASSKLGLERPGHKYIKRENLGNGKYRYIYDEAKGTKAPSSKDTEMMIGDFKSAVSQDRNYKRYAPYFFDSDYHNVGTALLARGEEVTPESIVQEMNNLKATLGTRVSEYLPAGVAANEYRRMFSMAGTRTTEYNAKLKETLDNKKMAQETKTNDKLSQLKAAGLNDQTLMDLKQNPRKINDLIDKLKSFANTGQ